MSDVHLHRATTEGDRAVLERLWLTFRHDMASHRPVLPSLDGTYRDERLRAALTREGQGAWVVVLADRPAGLALVRGLDAPVRVLSSFFVVRGARRTGVGARAVHELVTSHPGRWEVAYQERNAAAAAFWPRVAARVDPGGWRLQQRPVPGREDLPPDTWASFTATARP